jgi:sporulation protein YlmC with PRC-barrel domain
MKAFQTSLIILSVMFLAVFASSRIMADTPQQPLRSTQIDVDRGGVHIESTADKDRLMSGRSMAHDTAVRAKDLIGLSVYSTNNEDLGKVEDLVIDPLQGRISYAVLTFGGFLGMGDKYFAVPWQDLKLQPKGLTTAGTQKEDHYVLAIDKQALKNAPGFDKRSWPNFGDPNWAQNIEKFYGEHRRASRSGNVTR